MCNIGLLPFEIWFPFSTGAELCEWGEWLLAFLSCSWRDGEVGAEPQSSLPGRLILELNPGGNITRGNATAYRCMLQTVISIMHNIIRIPSLYIFHNICLPFSLLLLLGAQMLHTAWVSNCGCICVWQCEWEFISCCPTQRMFASRSIHGHKMPKYKVTKLYYPEG